MQALFLIDTPLPKAARAFAVAWCASITASIAARRISSLLGVTNAGIEVNLGCCFVFHRIYPKVSLSCRQMSVFFTFPAATRFGRCLRES